MFWRAHRLRDRRVGERQWARCGISWMARRRGREGRGYYALCAVLASWAVLMLIIGYNVAFLGEEGAALALNGGGALGGGAQTTSHRPSRLLLFQLAACTTLQFWRLRVVVTIALSFFERALHSTLPPITVTAIAHTIEEHCGGGGGRGAWGGSADFAASAAPYVFPFHLAPGDGGADGMLQSTCCWVGRLAKYRVGGGGAQHLPQWTLLSSSD